MFVCYSLIERVEMLHYKNALAHCQLKAFSLMQMAMSLTSPSGCGLDILEALALHLMDYHCVCGI